MEDVLARFAKLEDEHQASVEMFELLTEEGLDEGNADYDGAAAALEELAREVDEAGLLALLSGEHDSAPAIVTIHAGAGGTESHDWVDMLVRMYLRWAERSGHPVRILSELPGDVAGTKSITIEFSGPLAYGLLHGEHGVHRLVRISPFDGANRRHTSFASVDVIPRVEEDNRIVIDEKDMRIDTYRSRSCQNERSQHFNRESAMKVLRSKLAALLREEQKERLEDLRGVVKDIAWGNQIRSYVLHPYQMVKDLRTGYETGNTQRLLDGDIEPFMFAHLRYKKEQQETAGAKEANGQDSGRIK